MAIFCKYKDQIKKHFVDNNASGDFESLLKQAGANSTEAARINKTLSQRFKTLAKDDVNRLYAALSKDPKIKRDSNKYKQLLENAIEGKIRPADIDNAVAETFGLPGLSKERAAKINQLAQEIQALKKNPALNKNKITEKTLFLKQQIEESVPTAGLQKLDTYTTFNLLSKPSTSVVNVSSNILRAIGSLANQTARGALKASDIKLLSDIGIKTSKEVYSDIAKGIRRDYGLKSDLYDATSNARTFRPEDATGWKKAIETVGAGMEQFLRRTLEGPDAVVRNIAYASAITDILRGMKGVKIPEIKTKEDFKKFILDAAEGRVEGLSKEQFRKLQFHSEREAAEVVFQDDNFVAGMATAFGRLPDNLKTKADAAGLPLTDEVYLPMKFLFGTFAKFTKTPANVGVAALKSDPVIGTAMAVSKLLQMYKANDPADLIRREALKQSINVITATLGWGGLGYILEREGILVPEGYKGSYVLKFNDTNLNPASLLGPFMPSIGLGAKASEMARDNVELDLDGLVSLYGGNLRNVYNALADTGLFAGVRGMAEVFEDLGKSPEERKGRFVKALAQGGSQMIPAVSFMRGMAAFVDPEDRDTYSKNALKKAYQDFIKNIPGARQTLPVKRDTAGRPVKPISQNLAIKFANAFLNPMYARKSDSADPVFKELRKLSTSGSRRRPKFRYAPGRIQNKGESYQLSDTQKRDYQKHFGNYTYDRVKSLINTPAYVVKGPDERQEMIARIEREGRKFAKQQILAQLY